MSGERPIPHRHLAASERVSKKLSEIGFVLPGTLVNKKMRCGKKSCACRAEPPTLHGPYWVWTRKVKGKTVTRMLSDDQVKRYAIWFQNWRRLRELTTELQALSLEAMESIEG